MKMNPSYSILVIDDEPAIREYLRFLLENEGYTVFEAADGNEGIREAAERTIDVVITDLSMPGRDGVDTIAELKKRAPGIRIIALSGVGSRDRLLGIAGMYGADACMNKPFEPTALLSLLHHIFTGNENETRAVRRSA